MLQLNGFFAAGAVNNNLILSEQSGRFLVEFDNAFTSAADDGVDERAVVYELIEDDSVLPWLLALGVGAGGVALLASGGDGGSDHEAPVPPPPPFTVVDDVGPVVGEMPNGTVTNDATPTFYGSGAIPNATITLTISNYPPVTVTADANGNWTYTASTLPDGPYTVSVVQTDSSGQTSSPTTYEFVVDTTPPSAATTVSLDTITDDSGAAGDFITNDSSLIFSGSLGARLASDERVEVSLDGGVTWFEASVSGTTWSYDHRAVTLADGEYSVVVRVIDTAGNVGQTDSQTLQIDTTPPAATTTVNLNSITTDSGVVGDFITSDSSLIFNGSLGAELLADERVQLSLDGGATWFEASVSGTSWSYDHSAVTLPDGNYTVEVRVVDVAGNVGATDSQALQIDTTPPASTTTVSLDAITVDGGVVGDFITNDPSLIFSGSLGGTLMTDERVELSLDGGLSWFEATVSGATWSYDHSAVTLADGDYTVDVRVIDVAGNVGATDSQLVRIDTVPPASTTTVSLDSITDDSGAVDDFITNDPSLIFSGSLGAELLADERVQLSLDGGATWFEATVSGTSWSYDHSAVTLPDGNYTVEVRVIDVAGNVGATDSQALQIDTTPPASTTTVTIDAITDDSGVADDFITNDPALIFSGSLGAELLADERVELSLDGGTTWFEATVSGTTWSYDHSATTLPDGDYTVDVRVIDVAGNVGATDSQALQIDTTPPESTTTVTIDAITDDSGVVDDFITNDPALIFSGSLGAELLADERVELSLDGGATWFEVTVSGTTWSYDHSATTLPDGDYTIDVRVIDVAGNVGATDSQALQIDTTPPESTTTVTIDAITDDSGVADDFITNDPALIFSGSLGAELVTGERVELSLDGGTTWFEVSVSGTTWSYDHSATTLPDGDYTIDVRVIDVAGNVGATDSQALQIDTTPPESTTTVTIDTITDDSGLADDFITNDPALIFSGSLGAELVTGERVELSLDGGVTWFEVTVSGTTWSYDHSATTLPDGDYTIDVRVIDVAGNVGATDSQALQIDTTPPESTTTVTIDAITDDSGVADDFITNDPALIFSGSLGAELVTGERVELSLDGGTTWFEVSVSGTTWSYDHSAVTLPDGDYTVDVRVIDVAGNVGATDSQALQIDTTPPASTTTVTIDAITDDSGVADDFITNDPALIFSGSLGAELLADERVELSLDGGTTWFEVTVSGTTWSYDHSATTLPDGDYTVDVRVIDVAGNVGATDSQALQIDTTPPESTTTVTIDAITDDSGVVDDFITNDPALI
uniref:Ig-like domain-containing protein n=1 Tax=Pseudomonas sp. TTU2014-080ASC TaxID=1729724 RepID=UPI001F4CD9E5